MIRWIKDALEDDERRDRVFPIWSSDLPAKVWWEFGFAWNIDVWGLGPEVSYDRGVRTLETPATRRWTPRGTWPAKLVTSLTFGPFAVYLHLEWRSRNG